MQKDGMYLNSLKKNTVYKLSLFVIIMTTVLFLLGSVVYGENILIDFYQTHISAIDGDRCAMTPSCSAYANEAFEKHGPIVGWVMTCDRLTRCGHDEVKISKTVYIKGQPYINDPVAANDSWWFEKEKDK